MKRLLVIAAALLIISSNVAKAEPEITYEKCTSSLVNGFTSGITAFKCNDKYSLPSAFMYKCSYIEKYPNNKTLVEECEIFLKSLKAKRLSRLMRQGKKISI